jgi:serine/threonine-protein kinase
MKIVKLIVNFPGESSGTYEYTFSKASRFVVGRAPDCNIRIPPETTYEDISRHHCEFEIDPPTVLLRDLGSRNGTYVNEVLIGHRPDFVCATGELEYVSTEHELHDQDEVRIGYVTLRVEVEEVDDAPETFITTKASREAAIAQ